MSDAISRASEVLRARLTEIKREQAELERALKQLQAPSAGAARRTRTSAGSNSGRSRARATARRRIAPRGQRREQLLQFLAERPGARPKEIAEGLGISAANAQNVLRQAKQARAVVKRDSGYALPGKRAARKTTTSKAGAAP